MKKKVWLGCVMVCWALSGVAQSHKKQWVDSVFSTLDLPAKIGQLLMVSANSYDEDAADQLSSLIKKFKIGGVVFTKGGPVAQAKITTFIQHQAEVPLWIGMTAEEGLGAVLDSATQFPPPIMLGALQHDSLLYLLGAEVGRQLNELGAHINFAPTSNVSASLQHDELLYSTYGDNSDRVAAKVVAYQQGIHSMNILSVATHYPDNDMRVEGFQKGVPVLKVQKDPNRLFVLQKLLENGCKGVVTAYEQELIFPNNKGRFTQKKRIVSNALPNLYSGEYLKQQTNFKGLVFSFIPDIHELNKKFKPGDSEFFAFQAGNDVLLFPENIGAAVRKMRRGIKKNSTLQKQLDESVRKILESKYDVGLHTRQVISTENLSARITLPATHALQTTLFEKSLTVVHDEAQVLPISQVDNISFASISIGEKKDNLLTSTLSKYAAFTHYQLQQSEDTTQLVQSLSAYDVVVAALYPEATLLEKEYTKLLHQVSQHSKVIVVQLGSPSKLSLIDKLPTIIQGYTDHPQVQKSIPQLIFGAIPSAGKLPISVTETIKQGQGVDTHILERLGYSIPEMVGMSSKTIDLITSIAQEAIQQQATPGCQIIVARKGKIVYEQSFGSQTYENKSAITDETIYDLASVTKVAATLQATMFLYERGLIDIYKKASYYLPELRNTDKKDIILKDILTHQAGLTPFVPFWINTVKDSLFLPEYYSLVKNEQYPWQVAPNLYAIKSLKDSLWSWSIKSKMRGKAPRTPYNYTYSDVGLYILHHLNEALLNQPQEDFLLQNLYEPLGASTMGYLPLERFNPERIVPTENDKLFRRSLLLGTVHDEGAAMLGGVAGHAGLFSNAHDLAKLGQMLLQQGYYGGHRYFKPETVHYFTTKQFDTSRRGLGWDKPVQSEWNSPTSIMASPETYGHTGFTGTCIWIDPKFELVYVFLSNRVYPDRSNTKLSTLNIRSRIQDTIYQSIFEYSQYGTTVEKSIQFINK